MGSGIGSGRLADWIYDAAGMIGLLDREISYTGHGTFERDVVTRDVVDRPTSVRWKIPAVPGFATQYDFGFTYLHGGALATRTFPATPGMAAETVTSGYDAAGRLRSLNGNNVFASDTYLGDALYGGAGRLRQRVHGQGGNVITRSFLYDAATGDLNRLTLSKPSGLPSPNQTYTMQDEEYRYDGAGSLTGITTGHGTIFESTECFDNDNAGRLINNWRANGTACWNGQNRIVNGFDDEYVHNAWTVLKQVNDLTTPVGVNDTEYFFGSTGPGNYDHQPHTITTDGVTTDTFTYKPNGDLNTHYSGTITRSHTYDVLNRLSSVTVNGAVTEHAYDPGGQRVFTEEPDGTIRIYLDDTQLVLGAGWLPATVRQYAAGGTQFATRNSLLPDLQYTFGNHQGSSAIVVDDNPSGTAAVPAWQVRAYDPYGDTRILWQINNPQALGNNQRFLNQYHDTTTGLAYLNARYYNPTTRLFTQPDPLRQETRPQATNAYSYALNNPNNLTDPTGLDVCADGRGGCGGVRAGDDNGDGYVGSFGLCRVVGGCDSDNATAETFFLTPEMKADNYAYYRNFHAQQSNCCKWSLGDVLRFVLFDPAACSDPLAAGCGVEVFGILPWGKISKFERLRLLRHVDEAPSGVLDAASIAARSGTEIATAERLARHPQLTGRTLSGSSHVGADFIDDLGRTYDALGTPRAAQYWNARQFLASIDSHVLKSNDFTVVDLTGFTPQQVSIVDSHIASLSTDAQATIIRLGS